MVKRKSVRKRRGSNVRRRSSKRKISRRKKLNKYINKGGKHSEIALLKEANAGLEMKLEIVAATLNEENKELNDENKDLLAKNKELNDENKDLLATNKELNDKYEALKKKCNDEIEKRYDEIIKYENFLAKLGWQWHG